MRVVPHGLVFNSIGYWGDGRSMAYAQAPQGCVLSDRVRVFFTTRFRDSPSSWVSRPAFVDLSLDLRKQLSKPHLVDLPLGKPGTFDEHGIFPFSPIRAGDRLLAFTTGWSRRISVDVETSVGLVESFDDGLSFNRVVGDGPVLSASLDEPFLVGDAFVVPDGEKWRMWYIFGLRWIEGSDGIPERVYKITGTSSTDIMSWSTSSVGQIVPDVIGPNEAQALPSVVKIRDKFLMIFCYRPHSNFRFGSESYRLGFAESRDGSDWARMDHLIDFPASNFDSEMKCYPSWLRVEDRMFILYNGNRFGLDGFAVAEVNGLV